MSCRHIGIDSLRDKFTVMSNHALRKKEKREKKNKNKKRQTNKNKSSRRQLLTQDCTTILSGYMYSWTGYKYVRYVHERGSTEALQQVRFVGQCTCMGYYIAVELLPSGVLVHCVMVGRHGITITELLNVWESANVYPRSCTVWRGATIYLTARDPRSREFLRLN